MNSEKYIGLDVHQATISVAVLDATGRLIMESILETKAATILQFLAGVRGTLSVAGEINTAVQAYYKVRSFVEHIRHGWSMPSLPTPVDGDPVSLVQPMVAAFGLVHKLIRRSTK